MKRRSNYTNRNQIKKKSEIYLSKSICLDRYITQLVRYNTNIPHNQNNSHKFSLFNTAISQ